MAAKETILDFFNKKTVDKPESEPTDFENDSDSIHDTVLENEVSEKTGMERKCLKKSRPREPLRVKLTVREKSENIRL